MRKITIYASISLFIIGAFTLSSFNKSEKTGLNNKDGQKFHAYDFSSGIVGYSVAGCTCHGASNSNANLTLTGIPPSPIVGVPYSVTVTLSGPNPGAGFNLSATSGTFSNLSSSVQQIGSELTHAGTQSLNNGSFSFQFSWTPTVAGSVTFNVAGNNVDQNGSTGNDLWVQRSFNFNAQTLPVKIIYFNGVNKNGQINSIVWKVESETNFKNYDLEFSCDGINFTTVKTIQPLQGAALKTYEAEHNASNCNSTKNYYRLKINNLDNTFEYSQVIAITKNTKATKPIIFPNPSVVGTDKIKILGNTNDIQQIRIENINGQILKTYNLSSNSILNEITMPTGITSGYYYVQLIYRNRKTETLPLLIQ